MSSLALFKYAKKHVCIFCVCVCACEEERVMVKFLAHVNTSLHKTVQLKVRLHNSTIACQHKIFSPVQSVLKHQKRLPISHPNLYNNEGTFILD